MARGWRRRPKVALGPPGERRRTTLRTVRHFGRHRCCVYTLITATSPALATFIIGFGVRR